MLGLGEVRALGKRGWGSLAGPLVGPLCALGALAAVVAPGCNALVDTSVEQCQTTADCIGKGPAFANAVCTPDKVCSTGGDCTKNQECIERFGGVPAICRQPDRSCVQLLTKDCQQVFPEAAVAEDSTIVLGFMGPLVGEFASNGVPQWEGIQLAVDEFRTFASGLPTASSSTRRNVAVIGCHDIDDPIGVAKHLSQVVRVPAIFGPAFSGITLDVANKVTIPSGTLIISSSATSPAITDLDDNGLVWRTAPSDAIQAVPLAFLVDDQEKAVRTELGLAASAKIRVAMAVKGDAYGKGLANALIAKLKFNGKTAIDNGNDFLRQDYPDPSEQPNFDFSGVVSAIVAQKPHIVLALGTTEAITKVIDPVEKAWPTTGTPPPPKPRWILPDGGRLDELLALTGPTNADLRMRVVGTVPGRTTPLFQSFKINFKAFHQNKDPGTFADTAYDSFYLLSYAMVAQGAENLSGAVIGEGLKKTVGGTPIPAGTNNINAAFKALQSGGAIDYDGVSGKLDFDVTTGEAPADIDVWCVVVDSNNKAVFVSSGQYYDAGQDSVVGSRTACEATGGGGGTGGSGGGTGGSGGVP